MGRRERGRKGGREGRDGGMGKMGEKSESKLGKGSIGGAVWGVRAFRENWFQSVDVSV